MGDGRSGNSSGGSGAWIDGSPRGPARSRSGTPRIILAVNILRAALTVLFIALFPGPAAAADTAPCSRVVAVADLHGGYDALLSVLQETRLVDGGGRWTGADACLVQTGDIVDRGDRSRDILDLLMRLSAERPSRVHALLGNHEVMNLVGDLRYVSATEYAAFAAEETGEERETGYRNFLDLHPELPTDDTFRRAAFDQEYPAGWFAHRRAFSSEGRYGKWLLSRPVLLALEGSLFVHGGIDPADAPLGVEELNRLVLADLHDYVEARRALVEDGWLNPLVPFGEDFVLVRQRLEARLESAAEDESVERARRFLRLASNRFASETGPLWSRTLALADEVEFAPRAAQILQDLGVKRIVMGHTPQRSGRIGVRFDGTVFLIDTGAGPTYGGRPSALEIRRGAVRAVYPGESQTLWKEPELSHAEIERFLLDGKIVEEKEIGEGVTRPSKVVLERDGRRRKAAFKTVDVHRTGLTHFEGGLAESNFTDSYRYDRAAYLLDRHLGLDMVPVTVLRRVGSREGALVDWVEDAIDEEERRERNLEPPDAEALQRQREAMYVFDALIYNTDRNQGNQLFTLEDWRLHLIDHTRAFRQQSEIPKRLEGHRMHPTRTLYERLLELDAAGLSDLFGDLLTKPRVKALLARRDRIVERIERDRQSLGDEVVFMEAAPTP